MWLFALFLIVPMIEIALFIQVGGIIGLWPTLAIVVLTALIGTALMRSQGARALHEVQRSIAELRDPSQPMAHGAMILFAGALLLTPGFFTDTMGILLLIPPVRNFLLHQIGKRVRVTRVDMGTRRAEPHRPPYDMGVVDADYVVEPDEESLPPHRPNNRPSGWTQR